MSSRKRKYIGGFTGNTLKIIAMVSMLLDHIGAVVIEEGIFKTKIMEEYVKTKIGMHLYMADKGLRLVGRLAFPIYCFLLVEGFFHTRGLKKYILRMICFSVLSEVPFNLAMSGQAICLDQQNVFFTLTASLVMMATMERYKKISISCAAVGAACYITWLTNCDYGGIGPLMVAFMHIFKNNHKMFYITGIIAAGWESAKGLYGGIWAYIPISFYNGKRGNMHMKVLPYIFYPVHLISLVIIRIIVNYR